MSPLMTVLFEELRACYLDRYIDGFERDTYAMELDRLHSALCALLPEGGRKLLDQYARTLNAQALIENEAMFRAAFAAAGELG